MKMVRQILLTGLAAIANLTVLYFIFIFWAFNSGILPDSDSASEEFYPILFSPFYVAPLLLILLALVCAIFAMKTHGRAAQDIRLQKGLRTPVFVCKLLLVPVNILNLLIVQGMAIVGTLVWLIPIYGPLFGINFTPAAIVIAFIGLIFAIMLLLATSSFSISAIFFDYRHRIISRSKTVVFIILQLLPVVDVISWPLIVRHMREREAAVGWPRY